MRLFAVKMLCIMRRLCRLLYSLNGGTNATIVLFIDQGTLVSSLGLSAFTRNCAARRSAFGRLSEAVAGDTQRGYFRMLRPDRHSR
jgi:hypothetical protein